MIRDGDIHPYIGVSAISRAKNSAPDPVSRSFQKTLVQIRLMDKRPDHMLSFPKVLQLIALLWLTALLKVRGVAME